MFTCEIYLFPSILMPRPLIAPSLHPRLVVLMNLLVVWRNVNSSSVSEQSKAVPVHTVAPIAFPSVIEHSWVKLVPGQIHRLDNVSVNTTASVCVIASKLTFNCKIKQYLNQPLH